MREVHAPRKSSSRCSHRKREAGIGTAPVWNGRGSTSSAVKNIQKDETDLGAEVRAISGRIDSVRVGVDSVRDSVDALSDRMEQYREEDRDALDARFEKVDGRFAEMRKETKADFTAMTNRIDGAFKWALGLFIIGLGVLAHGFRWF